MGNKKDDRIILSDKWEMKNRKMELTIHCCKDGYLTLFKMNVKMGKLKSEIEIKDGTMTINTGERESSGPFSLENLNLYQLFSSSRIWKLCRS